MPRPHRDARGRFVSAPVRARDARGRFVSPGSAAEVPRTPIRAVWKTDILRKPVDFLTRETGLSPRQVDTIRKTGTATPEQRRALYNLRRREQYAAMKAAGFTKSMRDRYKGAKPELVDAIAARQKDYAAWIAQFYDRPIKRILQGLSKSKMTAEELDHYMKSKYPWAFDEDEAEDEDEATDF